MTEDIKVVVCHQKGHSSRTISAIEENNSELISIPVGQSRQFSLSSHDKFIKIVINGAEEEKKYWFVKFHSPALMVNLKSEYTENSWILFIKVEDIAGAAIPQKAETVNVTIGDDKTNRPD